MAVAAFASMFRNIAKARTTEIILGHEEITHWPPGLLKVLQDRGLLATAPDAQSTICPGCARACIMKVVRVEAHGARGPADFVTCDKPEDYGLIEIERHALEQWRLTRERIELFLARELGLRVRAREGSRDRIRYGASRQLGNAVILEFAATAELLIGEERIELVDLLRWDGSALHIDQQLIQSLVIKTRETQTSSKIHQKSKLVQERKRDTTAYRDKLLQSRAVRLKQEERSWTKLRIARDLKKDPMFADISIQRIMRIIRTRKK